MTQDSHHMSPRKFGSRRWLIDDFAAPTTPKFEPRKVVAPKIVAQLSQVQSSSLQTGVRPITPQHRDAQSVRRPLPEPVEQQAVVATAVPPRRKFLRRPSLLVVMASAVFVIGMGAALWTIKINSDVRAQVNTANHSSSDDEAPPATDAPSSDDINSYVTAPNMPRYLSIDKLGVKARVRTMGTTKSGAVQAPANVHDVGWYSGSSLPGVQGGAAFMDGHVSSWETDGIFKNLPKLVAGDKITVEMGDGRIFTYRVVQTETAPADKVDMSKALLSITPGRGGLNLMTCHGNITPGTDEFTERFMVYTEQI